jgi:hypothetical protein
MKPARRYSILVLSFLPIIIMASVIVAIITREEHRLDLNHALINAIKRGQTKTAVSMLASGADPNARDFPIERRSLWRQLWDRLRGKTQTKISDQPSALSLAFGSPIWGTTPPPEDTQLIKALLDAGASPNDSVGSDMAETPLIKAVIEQRINSVRLLLNRGAQVNTTDATRQAPLHYAVKGHNIDIVKALLRCGAAANIRTQNKQIPIFIAALEGRTDMIRLLLNYGEDVNARDGNGFSPLYCAVVGNKADCVRFLLTKGAKVDIKDTEGIPLIDEANNHQNAQIVKMLQDAVHHSLPNTFSVGSSWHHERHQKR